MLTTTLLYKNAFVWLSKLDKQYKCLPNESEWDLAKVFVCPFGFVFYVDRNYFWILISHL